MAPQQLRSLKIPQLKYKSAASQGSSAKIIPEETILRSDGSTESGEGESEIEEDEKCSSDSDSKPDSPSRMNRRGISPEADSPEIMAKRQEYRDKLWKMTTVTGEILKLWDRLDSNLWQQENFNSWREQTKDLDLPLKWVDDQEKAVNEYRKLGVPLWRLYSYFWYPWTELYLKEQGQDHLEF